MRVMHLSDEALDTVILLSKSNYIFLGYFDPVNAIFDSASKYISG